jgi:hypothetical protein
MSKTNVNNLYSKAACCHAAWYAYQVLALRKPGLPWWELSDEQKSASIDGVIKLDSIVDSDEFHKFTLDQLCEEMHKNWMNYKLSNGWKFGEVKNEETKEHPCLVEYSHLSEEDRVKDKVFIQAFLSIKSLEYEVVIKPQNEQPQE